MKLHSAHIALSHRRGYSALFTVVMLVALCGLVSLGVEVGHVQTAKTELRTAADAAARAAAVKFMSSGSTSVARQAAADAAFDNVCDGNAVVLDINQDVEFGAWDKTARTFTPLTGAAQNSASAIRITARRTASRGNAIPLSFAKVVGRSTCDVSAVSTVYFLQSSGTSGFIGLNGITFQNNTLIASYNSATNPNPTQFTSYTHGQIGSNAAISAQNNTLVMGNVLLGPAGSMPAGAIITGSTTKQTTAITAPTLPPWNPQSNPGGIPQNYTVSSDKTLPGGTYYFTSLTISADLSFSGPATLYVNGNVILDDSITAYHLIPSNLAIYQYGANTFGDSNSNNVAIVAEITAPNSNFTAKNNLAFYGSAIFNTITTKNNALLFYDEQSGQAGGKKSISLVK
jgi:Flp pilus assembly protein TadG